MIGEETRSQYTATIGIECHVQLKTKTKLFSAVDNDAREAPPNTLVNHIDFGLPGALPVLNKEAIHLASRAAFALGSKPQKFSKFDRKHYFYPDLPMGYQITQYDEPIILGGSVEIEVEGEKKTIGITRAHMEADAGKSVHHPGEDYSLVDLNRAGTPLLEIVSEPDMHSAAEAKAYAHELYLRMRYADVSDANLYYGNMRFDVNVSVSKTDELGTRTETKNLNSFRAVEKTIEYEIDRQIELLEKGGKIVQETRGWDDAKQKTFTQRTKENADDYRYMPDPDLPPIVLDDEYIEKIKGEIPKLPSDYRQEFGEIGIEAKVIEDIIAVPETARLVSRVLDASNPEHARRVAFWMMQPQTEEPENLEVNIGNDLKPSDEKLIKLSQMVSDNKLSSTAAKQVLGEMLKTGGDPEKIAEAKNLLQVSDEGEIAKIVEQVLNENQKAAEDVKNGEMKAIGFLVGQVMKASKGKANPSLAQDLIKKQLGL
ncbi:MAG TPA: Asp-tRNA(Asn)/Glu-tRNA(Gln) amidotransferase subunit GatB [Candidatus Saccharimonadales bacterium]|nr:Asp-tRNA(Asn)/Glu-tRNA(Gln) amidotransferase subunit GatB [Candidatus Saccharimonadales bacterium]